ncbi:hypothetical protein [Ferrimonas pelagia]|uniref:Phage tail tape measure protein n=1 Tax=Ferrimonas pelagia TaxID=1177826 RepID=A0ABP9EK17_9GAMM
MQTVDARFVIRADNQTDNTFRQVKTNLEGMRKESSVLNGVLGTLSTGLGAVGLAGGFSVTALAGFTSQTAAAIDEQGKFAASLGLTYTQLQTLDHQFTLTGVSVTEGHTALQRFVRRLAEARRGAGVARSALEDLGLDAVEVQAMDTYDAFGLVLDRLRDVADEGQRGELANRFFDMSWRALQNTMVEGSAGLANAREDLEKLNALVGDDVPTSAAQFVSAQERMFKSLSGSTTAFLVAVGVMEKGAAVMDWVATTWATGFNAASDSFERWGGIIDDLNTRTDAVGRIYQLTMGGLLGVSDEYSQQIHDAVNQGKAELVSVGTPLLNAGEQAGEQTADAWLKGYAQRMVEGRVIPEIINPDAIDTKPPELPQLNQSLYIPQDTAESWEQEQAALKTLTTLKRQASLAGMDNDARLLALRDEQLQQVQALADAHPKYAAQATAAEQAIHAAHDKRVDAQTQKEQEANLRRLESWIASNGTQEQQLEQSQDKRLAELKSLLDDELILEDEFLQRRRALEERFTEESKDLARQRYEEQRNWADRLYDELADASDLQGELFERMVDRWSSGMGSAVESAVFDSENLGDALGGVFEGMARSVVAFFGEWAAQRVAMWVLEKALGAGEAASYQASVTGRGMAETQLWAINAAASAAAIPITGWAMAPGVAAAAEAAGAGLTAAAAGFAATAGLAGMAHSGLDAVPREGTWLLDKGERVYTQESAGKLDAMYDAILALSRSRGGEAQVHIHNAPAGTTARVEQDDDEFGRRVIRVLLEDQSMAGEVSSGYQQMWGLQRQGRF